MNLLTMRRSKILAQRRAILLAECAMQRITLVAQGRSITGMAHWINVSSNLVERLKNMPTWLGALVAGLVIFLPGRTISVAKNGLLLWQVWRSISSRSTAK